MLQGRIDEGGKGPLFHFSWRERNHLAELGFEMRFNGIQRKRKKKKFKSQHDGRMPRQSLDSTSHNFFLFNPVFLSSKVYIHSLGCGRLEV